MAEDMAEALILMNLYCLLLLNTLTEFGVQAAQAAEAADSLP
jgi:hypothetical protein